MTGRELLNKLVPPIPPESRQFIELRRRLHSGEHGDEHDTQAELLLETHDSVWRVKSKVRRTTIEGRVLYLIAILLVMFSVALLARVSDLSQSNSRVIAAQAEGRRTAVRLTCGALSAVIDAGRSVIGGSGAPGSRRFTRNLEKLGFPSKKVRDAAARKAAASYAQLIADRIRKETGLRDVVRRDGTLDCNAVDKAARVNATP